MRADLVAPRFACVDVGPVLEQHACRGDAAAARQDHQGRLPILAGCVHVGTARHEQLDDLDVADNGGFRQRRCAKLVAGVDVGACVDEPFHEVGVVVVHGPMERRRAIHGWLVGIGAVLELGDRGCRVVALHDIDEIGRGRSREPGGREQSQAGTQSRAAFEHDQTSEKSPVLSPTASTGTPERTIIVSSKLASGVRSG